MGPGIWNDAWRINPYRLWHSIDVLSAPDDTLSYGVHAILWFAHHYKDWETHPIRQAGIYIILIKYKQVHPCMLVARHSHYST